MDSRIENLKSTTFCGTRLTRRQIADIQKTVKMFPALSRHELAAALCSHLGWFTPKGRDRDRLGSCLRMLEQLESCGIVSLPAKRPGSRTGTGGRRRPVVSIIFCNFQWERRPAHMGGSPLGAKFSGVSCRLLPCLGFRFGCANHADPVI